MSEKAPLDFQYRIITPQGDEKTMKGTNRLIFDEKNNVIEIIGAVQYITKNDKA